MKETKVLQAAAVLSCVTMLLSACSGSNMQSGPVNNLPELSTGPVVTESKISSTGEFLLFDETFDDGLCIKIKDNGDLLLSGANVTKSLKEYSALKDYLPDILHVILDDGVEIVGEKAFRGFETIEKLTIGDSVREISYNAFADCKALETVDFGSGLEIVGDYAFSGCAALKDIIMGPNVREIGPYAFADCEALKSAAFQDGIENIGYNIFSGCNTLKSIRIGSSIPESSFRDIASLESVSIQSTVKNIGSYAFSGCTGLKNVQIQEGAENIESYAFYKCTALTEIVMPASLKRLGTEALSGCTGLCSFKVRPGGALVIEAEALLDCSSLKELELSDGLLELGDKAIKGCTSLEKLVLPRSIKKIGYHVMEGTSAMRNFGYRGNGAEWAKIKFASEWNNGAQIYSPKMNYKD